MVTSNSYNVYSEYYDAIVDERRDFGAIADVLAGLIGNRKKLLEVGVGTGLVVEKLIQHQSHDYEIWGIDNSQPLLEKAKEKLKPFNTAHLYLSDVLDFDIKEEFEAIYSRGGAFFFIEKEGQRLFASHLLDKQANLKALVQIRKHLQEQGIFLVSIVDFKHDEERNIKDEVIYRRETHIDFEDGQTILNIQLSFEKQSVMIGEQNIRLLLMNSEEHQELFDMAGLQQLAAPKSDQYCIYVEK